MTSSGTVSVSDRALTALPMGTFPFHVRPHSAARPGMFHLAGRAAVAGPHPRDQQGDASLARSRLPDHHGEDVRNAQPQVEPARSHSLQDEGPVTLHSSLDDVTCTAETSPVSPELAGGPLGYRDKKAPAWAGRGADAPFAAVEASAAGAPGRVVGVRVSLTLI